jgi:hypothetical protein
LPGELGGMETEHEIRNRNRGSSQETVTIVENTKRSFFSTLGSLLGKKKESTSEATSPTLRARVEGDIRGREREQERGISKQRSRSSRRTLVETPAQMRGAALERFRPIFESGSSSSNESITIEMRDKQIYDEYMGGDVVARNTKRDTGEVEDDIADMVDVDKTGGVARHKHQKITKGDLMDLLESMDTIKQQIIEADFEQMEEYYMTNYTLASLYQIGDYYKLRRRVLKQMMVQDIVLFETNVDNFEKVYKRRKLWAYLEELKADEFLSKYISIQVGCE